LKWLAFNSLKPLPHVLQQKWLRLLGQLPKGIKCNLA
jgi:hypothetical protein